MITVFNTEQTRAPGIFSLHNFTPACVLNLFAARYSEFLLKPCLRTGRLYFLYGVTPVKSFIHRFATPLMTGLFIVSTVSGVALFFHWGSGLFHSMHEWLSMLLLLPFVLHAWKNWKLLVNYARRKTLLIPLLASLLVAVPFAVNGFTASQGGNPAFRTVALLSQAPLSELAPVLKTTPEMLLSDLQQRGYKADSAQQSLDAIAAASGAPANQLLFAMLPSTRL